MIRAHELSAETSLSRVFQNAVVERERAREPTFYNRRRGLRPPNATGVEKEHEHEPEEQRAGYTACGAPPGGRAR